MFKCDKCELALTRKNIIRLKPKKADVLYLLEEPNEYEDLSGHLQIKLLKKLNLKLAHRLKFHYLHYILCKSPTLYPKSMNVLACRENIIDIVNKVNPSVIIAMGKDGYNYYKKVFIDEKMYQVTSLNYIIRSGGVASQYYMTLKRNLGKILSDNFTPKERG